MATSKAKKSDQLKALTQKFKNASGVAFVRYDGPSVMEVQAIRRALREQGMTYTVIKKTLMALAAKDTKIAEFSANDLEGPVAVIISETDEIAPAAAIKKLKKEFKNKETKISKFDFAGSIFEGKFLDPAATAILAETPSKEESLAKFIATMRHGPQTIHSTLVNGLRGITMSLKEAEKFSKA